MIDGTHHFVGLTTAAEAKVSLMSPWMLIIVIVMIVLCSPWWFCMVTIVMLMVVVTILMHRNLGWLQCASAFSAVFVPGHPRDSYVNLHSQKKISIYVMFIDRYDVPYTDCVGIVLLMLYVFDHGLDTCIQSKRSQCALWPQQKPPMWWSQQKQCAFRAFTGNDQACGRKPEMLTTKDQHTLLSRGFQAAPCPSWSHGQAGQPPDICKIFSGSPNLLAFPQLACINPFLLILNVPLILKTGIHLQFPKISVWPIWLLIDPL